MSKTIAFIRKENSGFKSLLIVILLFSSFISNAQEATPSELICSNEYRSKWFVITPHFKEHNGVNEKNYLTTIKSNIGKCSNGDILKFSFVDGKYMNVKSAKVLSCNGTELIFPLNPIQKGVLEMKPIKFIQYINGNDGGNFIYNLTKINEDYFINILIK
jgi:hypothetical protein